jgi:transcriptional regulator
MYVPPKFAQDESEAWQIVSDAGAGMLIANGASGLVSVFVPVVVSEDRHTILSHLAKANQWCKAVRDGDEVLALFLAASAYVSPSYYPSRFENPGVVPTWNYVAAEVRARVTIREESQWKATQVRLVTEQFERSRDPQWRVDDLDETYLEQQLRAIVGLELEVLSIEGKAKLSQNRPSIDHDSVRENLMRGTLGERNVALRMKPLD